MSESDTLKVKALEKKLLDLGYKMTSSETGFHIYDKRGVALAMPETIEGAYNIFNTLKWIHNHPGKKLIK